MLILGIETSCDETAAAVVEDGIKIHSNAIYSQIAKHRPYGGVVPEIASRNHVAKLPGIVEKALEQAGVGYEQLDAIAVTYGPGLASSLLVGYAYAKGLALRLGIPVIGVNHHAGHLHSVFMTDETPVMSEMFPMLALMVSGGDSSLIHMQDVGRYEILGSTIDDAAGEALDKAAALLELGYPGGPVIQKCADGGNPSAIRFPRGLEQPDRGKWVYPYSRDLCFSFSGLKTSLLTYVQKQELPLSASRMADVTASFQEAVADALVRRVAAGLERYEVASFSCAGGVSLNRVLRKKLTQLSEQTGVPLLLSPPALCTDNAAMIAGVAYEQHQRNEAVQEPIDVSPSLRLHDWQAA
jgi:N6-L-threonylcarbamoyladenine synthase